MTGVMADVTAGVIAGVIADVIAGVQALRHVDVRFAALPT